MAPGLPCRKQSSVVPLKHKRYTERPWNSEGRRMTIALGMLASTGVVLATDTEESWGDVGDIKTATTKMISVSRKEVTGNSFCMAVAGAGNSDYLQRVKLELAAKVFASPTWRFETSSDMVEEYLLKFYGDHITPFWPDVKDFQLIAGVAGSTQGHLWITDKTTVVPCPYGYEAVGVGRAYATALLSRFHSTGMNLESCSLLAIHVVHCVKEFIGGCGKQTHVVACTAENNVHLNPAKVDEAERLLKKLFAIDHSVVSFAISYRPAFAGIAHAANKLREDLKGLDLLNRAEQPNPQSTTADLTPPPPSQESPGGSGEF